MKSIKDKYSEVLKSVKDRINNMFDPRSITRCYDPDITSLGGDCLEKCMIKKCMIGSATCQECENCIDKDNEWHNWIICKKIKKAIG